MDDNKKVGLILLVSTIVVIAFGGIGYITYEHHVKEEQTKLIKKSAKQIDEFYKWNYIGVDKITTSNKLWKNPVDGQLSLNYTVYFNGNRKKEYSVGYDSNNNLLLNNNGFYKDEKEKPIIKVPESAEYNDHPYSYRLSVDDIKHLKESGFNSNITGNQIKQELLKLHPNHFKEGIIVLIHKNTLMGE